MDYLDELDDSAMQALLELGGDIGSHTQSPASAPTPILSSLRCPRRVEAIYLLRLEAPLCTSLDVANTLGLSRVPQLESGTGEDGEALFCRLPQSSINALDSWAAKNHPARKFTKVRLGLAHKDSGELPLLGRDPTLPHHRPSLPVSLVQHSVHEYPVYYFFYGTLADPERLGRLLDISSSKLPQLHAATLLGGRIRTWAGKYRALVDWPGGTVEGFVFPVTSTDQEDALRVYEGDSYEIVAASFILGGKVAVGRTFRFSGFEDELAE